MADDSAGGGDGSNNNPLPPPEARLLPDPPTDGITGLKYLPVNNNLQKQWLDSSSTSTSTTALLASVSWDGALRIHDTTPEKARKLFQQSMDSGPLLSLAVSRDKILTGGLDGSIRMLNLESLGTTTDASTTPAVVIGRHQPNEFTKEDSTKVACSCLGSMSAESEPTTVVASAGWHRMFHLWDIRQSSASSSSSKGAVASVPLPGKAFSMDVDTVGRRAVVACSGLRNCFIDVRMMTAAVADTENDKDDARNNTENPLFSAKVVLDRESTMKYQTQIVRFFRPEAVGIAVGTVEGRVAIEFMEELDVPPPAGKKKYAFKCHRQGDLIYPVTSVEFHPVHGTFATGGCDGTVVTWDGLNKKKLASLPKFPSSIAALAFNHDGTELAIASSYTFEEGEREHPIDEIYVRKMLDSEVQPKSKS